MKPRKYYLSIQETPYFCVPSICQAILRRYSLEESQIDIAQEIKCTPETKSAFNQDLADFFRKRNLALKIYNYDEVLMRIPELVMDEWQDSNGNLIVGNLVNNNRHARLALDFDYNYLFLIDPENASVSTEKSEKLFEEMWKNQLGIFGLVKKL